MDGKILGMDTNTFFSLLFLILLLILGLVTFQYYAYVSGGGNAALRAGTGANFAILPGYSQGSQVYQG